MALIVSKIGCSYYYKGTDNWYQLPHKLQTESAVRKYLREHGESSIKFIKTQTKETDFLGTGCYKRAKYGPSYAWYR